MVSYLFNYLFLLVDLTFFLIGVIDRITDYRIAKCDGQTQEISAKPSRGSRSKLRY
jgi:hypothetical protein